MHSLTHILVAIAVPPCVDAPLSPPGSCGGCAHRPAAAEPPYHPDEEQDVLAQAVDSGRRALLDGDDARAAVIACYAAMETSLAASGIARRASDSPQDLLERASAGGLLTGPRAPHADRAVP